MKSVRARFLIVCVVTALGGCAKAVSAPDGGSVEGVCTSTWQTFGQNFFVTNCTGCHSHDHANFVNRDVVVSELALIKANIENGSMPQEATLTDDEKQRVLTYLSCGAPIDSSDAGFDFEAVSARAAVAKVKNVLVGLPPSDDEVAAVRAHPEAMKELVAQWQQLPQYDEKMRVFFELAFQQPRSPLPTSET